MATEKQKEFSEFKEYQMEYEELDKLLEQIEFFEEKTGFWMIEGEDVNLSDAENTDETILAYHLSKVKEKIQSLMHSREIKNKNLYSKFRKQKHFTA